MSQLGYFLLSFYSFILFIYFFRSQSWSESGTSGKSCSLVDRAAVSGKDAMCCVKYLFFIYSYERDDQKDGKNSVCQLLPLPYSKKCIPGILLEVLLAIVFSLVDKDMRASRRQENFSNFFFFRVVGEENRRYYPW